MQSIDPVGLVCPSVTDDHQHPCPPPHHCPYGHEHTWFASFTDDTCVPVSEAIYEGNLLKDREQRVETLYNILYSNVTTGIKSEEVFDPPAYCGTNSTDKVPDGMEWHRFFYV